LALARLVGDRWLIADALSWLGTVADDQGDHQQGRALSEEALAVAQELGAPSTVARLRWQLASLALDQGDQARATALFTAGLAEARQWQDTFWPAFNLLGLGRQAQVQGEPARARILLEEALDLLIRRGDQPGAADARLVLGLAVWQQGDAERATALLRASLAARHAMGGSGGIPKRLEALATVAAGRGPSAAGARRAARLLGAAAALRQSIGAPLKPVDRPGHEATLQAARLVLGERAFVAAWAAGRALPLDEAIAEALADDGAEPAAANPSPPPRPTPPLGLTAREAEVLRLVAEGLSDAHIAERLFVSRHTVNGHLKAIYGKLGVTSRTAAARVALDHGLR
jgi:ATP/maltotriose-dependent transcriptional regulator MalT